MAIEFICAVLFLAAVYAIDSQNSQVSKISQSLGFAADVFSDAVIAVSEDNSFMIINVQGSAFYLVDIAAAKKQDGGIVFNHEP